MNIDKNSQNEQFKQWEAHIKSVLSQNAWLVYTPLDELKTIEEGISAIRVAAYWYHFSVFAADFLCLALGLLQNHGNRSYVAQTVNEELGNGIPEQIHSVLLLEALTKVGIDKQAILAYPTIELDQILEPFKQRLLESKNDYEIAGFFLGFELLAEYNISHVFECLQPYKCTKEELRETPYFQEHFQVEPEHIRRALTMGLNCCSNEHQIKSMLHTYHHGISFWNRFWKMVHQDIFDENGYAMTTKETSLLQPLLSNR